MADLPPNRLPRRLPGRFAAGLVLEGVDIKTAQTRLGHTDPRLTLGIYAQATTEADRQAADRLGDRFLPRRDQDRGRGLLVELTEIGYT
ncbi:MAG: hypothetical protein P1T08_06935 [Acidimicrobiia bacterium]|nr:hypothetical protein [Acidimicrobiia bacterium]